ncbi:hypothetical protein HAX54_036840, partial [Datura stramonium]|nr:hypothetical protein [Datura stramonium]
MPDESQMRGLRLQATAQHPRFTGASWIMIGKILMYQRRDKSLAHRTAPTYNSAASRRLPPAFRRLSRWCYKCLLLMFHL